MWKTTGKTILMAIAMACSYSIEASNLRSDDFNSATSEPNPTWRFYDPYNTTGNTDSGQSKLTFDGTNALIDIPGGLAHDLWNAPGKNKAPRLLQTTSDTDLQFEVKFETSPSVKHQMQGIIVQESDSSFLRFDIFYSDSAGGVKLFAAYVDASSGETENYKFVGLPNGSPAYRQVIRSGDNWTFRYSYDGSAWTNAVTFTKKLVVKEVGLFAGTAGINPSFLSSADYFMNLDNPITDNDTWTPPGNNGAPPIVNAWYDYNPQAGQPGSSQKWFNILGNVSSDLNLTSLTYSLNSGAEQTLRFAPDGSNRLENDGDYTIEIDRSSLLNGQNHVVISAKDDQNQLTQKTVTLNYNANARWPFPYTANWGSLSHIRDVESVAHVVDGLWELTPNGVRTAETGYDRAITVGDINWDANYEVTVPFTPHSGFSGIGFAVGWQGHDFERSESPRTGWPLQSLAWVRGPINKATLEILTYGGPRDGRPNPWENIRTPDPQKRVTISVGETYMLKSSSVSLGGGMSRFKVKLWKQSQAEPAEWGVQADIKTRKGSVFITAYNGDVTFGDVIVKPNGGTTPVPTTPPVCQLGADPQTIDRGEGSALWWWTDQVNTANIDNSIGGVTLPSSFKWFHPSKTATYTMTARSASGATTRCNTTIYVRQNTTPAPQCTLGVDPQVINAGEGTALWWWTKGGDHAQIDNGIGSVSLPSSYNWIRPERTTRYNIRVVGSDGTAVTCNTTITVR